MNTIEGFLKAIWEKLLESAASRWFRRYLRVYGVVHVLAGVIALSRMDLYIGEDPAVLTYWILLSIALAILGGIAAFLYRPWGALPVTLFTLLISSFALLMIVFAAPLMNQEQSDRYTSWWLAFTVLEGATAIMYWLNWFSRKSVDKFHGKKEVEIKKRNPMLAPLLSIVSPGLGQMYNGQLEKGIIFYLIGYLLFFLVSLTGLQFKFYGLIFILALLICVLLFIMGDALIVALKKKEIVLMPYNKWYFYVIFAILAFGISKITDVDPFGGIKAYSIPTGTMVPTLMIGDRIIINLDYYKTKNVKRGDIVVFRNPQNPEKDMIKRVIAIEGNVIEGKNKKIFVNGEEITEPYIQHSDSIIRTNRDDTRDNFGPVSIPKNKIFVMGDNRDQSYDSRYLGFVDVQNIKGKALYIYWSENKSRIGREIK